MKQVLFLFMIFSIIGWLWETPWVSLRTKKYINRGFLKGPYIPIYGFAIVSIILSMEVFNVWSNSSIFLIIIQIIYIGFVTAVWEFFTSWSLEKLFHTRWWDYSSHKFNFQGRISLHVTLFFALSGYVLWNYINPVFVLLYNSIPSNALIVFLSIFYLIFSIDSYFTLRDLFKLREIIIKLEKLSKEITEKFEVSVSDIKEGIQFSKDYLKGNLVEVKSQIQVLLKNLPNGPTVKKIKNELEQVSKTLKTRSRIYRFMSKYPNSFSTKLTNLKIKLRNTVINKYK